MKSPIATCVRLLLLMWGAASGAQEQGAPGVSTRGQQLYLSQGCAACHGLMGQGAEAGARLVPKPIDLAHFTQQLREPRNAAMPAYAAAVLSNADVGAIHAYLISLRVSQGESPTAPIASAGQSDVSTDDSASSSRGRQLYLGVGCYQCHGVQGQGSGFFGPRIAPDPIALDRFARALRLPRRAMPIYTPLVLPEKDLQDIYAYVQSIPKAKAVAEISLLNR